MTRNQVLAIAALIGVVAASVAVAAQSVSISDHWLYLPTELKAANVLSLVAEPVRIVAFACVAIGFLSAARPARLKRLAVGSAFFVGYGVATATAAILEAVSVGGDTWKFTAGAAAEAAGDLAIAAAAIVAAFAFIAAREKLLAGSAAAVSIGYAFLAVAYGFFLAAYLGIPFPLPDRLTWGVGVIAGGRVVAAIGAAIVVAAFAVVWGRPAVLIGIGAIVFAVGTGIEGAGLIVLTSGGAGAGQWLGTSSTLVLAVSAAIAGVAFFLSPGWSEQRDGPDLAVLPDPA